MDRTIYPKQRKDNITPFRRDKRLTVTVLIRVLSIVLMLGTVLFAFLNYRDDLNVSNLKRLLAYAKASSPGTEGFEQYAFEVGVNTVYVPFDMGLAVVGGDTYRFISGLDVNEFSLQIRYTAPGICAATKQLLLYDRGNTGYSLVNSYALLHQAEAESPIISAAINLNGTYALVTSESGYRGGVSLYDSHHNLLCRWQTPEYYVMMVSVTPKSDGFAAVCLEESEGRMNTKIIGFSTKTEESLYSISMGDSWVYSICHDKSGNLVILCDDNLSVYNGDGQLISTQSFSTPMVMFSHWEESMPLIALKSLTGSGERVIIRCLDIQGETVFEQSFSGSLRDMDYRDGIGYLLFSDRVVALDLTEGEAEITQFPNTGARNILRTRNGECILVYSDRAVKIDMDDVEILE